MRLTSSLFACSLAFSLLLGCDPEPEPAESCQAIVDVCHDVDPGSGPITDCHDTAHEFVEADCDPIETSCVALCVAAAADGGAQDGGHEDHDGGHEDGGEHHEDAGPRDPVCQAISSACHDVDPGSGPIHDCHDVGHDNVAAACAAEQASCIALCEAAAADGGAADGG